MAGDLAGAHALVTGGGRGIGLAIATALGTAGARVTLAGRDGARLDKAALVLRERKIEVQTVPCDVGDAQSVACAFDVARQGFDAPNILVKQRRPGRERALSPHRSRPVAAHDRGQPDRHVSLLPRGAAGDARGGARPHRQHRQHGRAQGLCLCRRLLRGQARGGRPDPRPGAGDGQGRRDRERGLSGLHRHRHGRGQRGAHRGPRPDAARPRRGRTSPSPTRGGAW